MTKTLYAFTKWTRTYPPLMHMGPTDHLAVGSGAWARYQEDPDRFAKTPGGWTEDMEGVLFEDTDPCYLDWVLTRGDGKLQRAIGWWRQTPRGKYAFSDEVYAGRETGWMYRTVGSYLAHTERRDSTSEFSASGFSIHHDVQPDDGWYNGAQWVDGKLDWEPEPHQVSRLLAYIKARRVGMRYETVKSGVDADTPIGEVLWKSKILVTKRTTVRTLVSFTEVPVPTLEKTLRTVGYQDRITPVGLRIPSWADHDTDLSTVDTFVTVYVREAVPVKLPAEDVRVTTRLVPVYGTAVKEDTVAVSGQWIPDATDAFGCVQFRDRHAWDAALWVLDELRSLYTDVVENGELVVPDGEELGPVAWVLGRVEDIVSCLPEKATAERQDSLLAVCRTAWKLKTAVEDAAYRVYEKPPAVDNGVHDADTIDLHAFLMVCLAEFGPSSIQDRKRIARSYDVVRVSRDVACAGPVGFTE